MDLKSELIERDLIKSLVAAGMHPGVSKLALPKINRDGITVDEVRRTTSGTRKVVAAFRKENPELFGKGYRDSEKTLEQLERERDQAIFGRSAAGHE